MEHEAGAIVSAVGNVGAFGLIAWLIKHTFGHTIPRLASDFRESIASERDAYMEEAKQQRREFLEELRRITDTNLKERHECLERMESLRIKVEDLTSLVRRGV